MYFGAQTLHQKRPFSPVENNLEINSQKYSGCKSTANIKARKVREMNVSPIFSNENNHSTV
jgi:hypothetical protein